MTDGPYWRWTATDLAREIRAKSISARDVMESVLHRVETVNPTVNALTDILQDHALAAADRADKAVADGDPVGPLHGVPISLKINVDLEGSSTTDGVPAFKDRVATSDSPVVANLKDAGGIVFARNNAPAFSLRWFTDNDINGRTRNPFDHSVTPGGSSGGAAVAAATGMGPLAHGNDLGGSVRYPAWACGVVGLRPGRGRVPAYRATSPARAPSNQLASTQGILTRSVADVELALSVMQRGSPLDPDWRSADGRTPPASRLPKVGLFAHHPSHKASQGVAAALDEAGAWLIEAGCEVEEVCLPHFDEASDLWCRLVFADTGHFGARAIVELGGAAIAQVTDAYLKLFPGLTVDKYMDGLSRRFEIARDWATLLDRYDVILMPISWQNQLEDDADLVSQERVAEILAAQSPLLSTAILGLPGLSVPTGIYAGLPGGVQLISRWFGEENCLRAGAIIESYARFCPIKALGDRYDPAARR